MSADVTAALAAVTGALPAAEERPGQRQMAQAVASSIDSGRHLVVQAGTGTGKTLGYLVPAIVAGKRVVVATATKALQDQLAAKDLPFLEAHLGIPFDWAVLKGRSNYVCMQRVREIQGADSGQLELEEFAATTKVEINRLVAWSGTTDTGDQAGLDWAPSDRAWQAVSVGSDECPGATRCPMGSVCFAEAARTRASVADVVVVNMHLYGLHVGSGGMLLPEHDVVVMDEAHQLEDIMSDTVGVQVAGGRFTTLTAALKRIIDDPQLVGGVAEASLVVRDALVPFLGQRLPRPFPAPVQEMLVDVRGRVQRALTALGAIDSDVEDAKARKMRGQQLATRLQDSIDLALDNREGFVAFVSGGPDYPRLEIAPLDVGGVLNNGIWSQRTAILASATIPASLGARVGLPPGGFDEIDVGSPFDYEHHAMLYCAVHMPDPRSPAYGPAVHQELTALITAAGGRTLALFTSWKAMDAAAEAVRLTVDVPILTQRDLPKTALVKAFSDDEHACLFATAGFFQGVDIPGRTLSLVVIDRIPFPRPDDPLLSARREVLGAAAFSQIDLPRASMLLAQATGRLIRTANDRGVVAVMDPRLGKANYRWDIVKALPPMKRTRHRAEAEAFLREITAG
ncbi:MAG: ATP-dependent DNA helicase [Ilumatobacteraceae bacterium]|nr:ATP-dependent DNA helicase [Acidimicrobiaceae bacterium]MBP6487511.1 ATP-dependent DNA helicase [Ilumatobacteraceae bacterium]MBP7887675.1 ATP-dependent DNA helicase [Ilumatobacteraceae bacterium]MBP8207931.1 ATP-dependent DNA helicase [Ilumatobacteraceae bacterium]